MNSEYYVNIMLAFGMSCYLSPRKDDSWTCQPTDPLISALGHFFHFLNKKTFKYLTFRLLLNPYKYSFTRYSRKLYLQQIRSDRELNVNR